MTKNQAQKIIDLLATIDVDVDLDYMPYQDIDDYNSLYEYLDENDYLNVEIIYYYNAMEYLKEHDQSLRDSMAIAHEYGYTVDNLNSELLASLHATQAVRDNLLDLENDIEDILLEDQ